MLKTISLARLVQLSLFIKIFCVENVVLHDFVVCKKKTNLFILIQSILQDRSLHNDIYMRFPFIDPFTFIGARFNVL